MIFQELDFSFVLGGDKTSQGLTAPSLGSDEDKSFAESCAWRVHNACTLPLFDLSINAKGGVSINNLTPTLRLIIGKTLRNPKQ